MLISSRNTLLDTPRRIFGHITGYHADQEHGKGQANQNSVLRQLTGPWCQSEHPRILLLKVRSLLTVASHRCLVWILGSTPDLLNQKLYRGPGNLYYYKLLRYLKCGKCWFIESYKSSFLAWNLWARYVWNQDLFFFRFSKNNCYLVHLLHDVTPPPSLGQHCNRTHWCFCKNACIILLRGIIRTTLPPCHCKSAFPAKWLPGFLLIFRAFGKSMMTEKGLVD